jgi:hypothetical protein
MKKPNRRSSLTLEEKKRKRTQVSTKMTHSFLAKRCPASVTIIFVQNHKINFHTSYMLQRKWCEIGQRVKAMGTDSVAIVTGFCGGETLRLQVSI